MVSQYCKKNFSGPDRAGELCPVHLQRELELGDPPREHRQQAAGVRADRVHRGPGGHRPQDQGVHLPVELHPVAILCVDHPYNDR